MLYQLYFIELTHKSLMHFYKTVVYVSEISSTG